jgi:hypothetical protein
MQDTRGRLWVGLGWVESRGMYCGHHRRHHGRRRRLDGQFTEGVGPSSPRILALLGVGEVDTEFQDVGVAVGKISD